MHFDHIVILAEPALKPTLKINTLERIEWLMPDPAKASEEREAIINAIRETRDFIREKLEKIIHEKSL